MQCMKYTAVNADSIIARAANKRGYYLTACMLAVLYSGTN